MAIRERTEYDPWQRAFAGHLDPQILIDGICDEESALKAHRKAHEHDASPEQKKTIAEKVKQYR